MSEYIQTDANGRKRIVNCCERCGKITDGVHTCTPNPVIARLTAELAARHRKEDWALLILGFCAEGGVVGSAMR